MNIAVLTEKFWPEGSGGELATYLFLKEIASRKNWYFKIITGTDLEKIPQDIKEFKNIDFKFLKFYRSRHRLDLWLKIYRNIGTLLRFLRDADILYLPGLGVIVSSAIKKRNNSIRIIHHSHGYLPLSYNSAVYYPYEERMKRIYIDTCLYAGEKGLSYLLACLILHYPLTHFVQKNLKTVDSLICVSKRQAHIINYSLPWTKNLTRVVYNPIPKDVFTFNDKSLYLYDVPTLIYTGGDNPVKGFNFVIEIIRYIGLKNNSNVKFILTNNYSEKSVKKIKKVSKGNVELLGRVERNKLLELYSRSWILVFPSIYEEPLPYTVVEASLLNTLPVSFPVGGVPEIIEGTIASKFISYDISINSYLDRIEKAIEVISNNRDILSTLNEKIRPKFSYKNTVGKLIEVFEENFDRRN